MHQKIEHQSPTAGDGAIDVWHGSGVVVLGFRNLTPYPNRSLLHRGVLHTIKVDNISNAVATILAVDVAAINADGNVVPSGCQQPTTPCR